MGIQGAVLDQERDDRFVIGHLSRVVQRVAVVGREIGPGLDEQTHNVLTTPQCRVEDRSPAVLVIGIDYGGGLLL